MQAGSLVECVEHSTGILRINGIEVKVMSDIAVGTICTAESLEPSVFEGKPVLGILLNEDPDVYHPITGSRIHRLASKFREIQPPMSIPESLFNQSPEKVTV